MMDRIVFIGGTTASGKTALSLSIAQEYDGEIISCDSMQIYRHLDIGTAKPTAEERRAVPHWLIDFLEPDQTYSVYDYVTAANEAIRDIRSRGKTPIVCGGTGMYMSALLHGYDYSDTGHDSGLLKSIEAVYDGPDGPEILLDEIRRANPDHAERISTKDRKRIVRAVELLRMTGSTYSFHPGRDENGHIKESRCVLLTADDRSVLYDRIHARVDAMMQKGLLDEARWVYENRERFRTAVAAIGYKEFFPYFEGIRTLAACVDDLKQATRHYAKRQLTWFRKETEFKSYYIDRYTQEELYQLVKEYLVKD